MFRKNTTGQFIHVQGVDATTGGIKTGVSWTVRRCIDGTFAAATGTATEDGTTGWYKFALSQADTNGNNIGFNFTGTGAVPQTINIVTTVLDPTSTAFGLSLAKTTNITGFNDIAATAVVSSGAITTSGGAVSTVTTATNVTTVNGLAANVITAAAINTGAITNAKFAAGAIDAAAIATGAIDADALSADAGAELADAVWDEVIDASAHTTANSAGMRLASLGSVIHASVNDAAATAASFVTTLTSATDNFYADQKIRFTSGTLAGQSRIIYSYTGSSKTCTFDEPFTSAPANGATFDLIPYHLHTISQIADYAANFVWDEDATAHQTGGTFGQAIGDPAADTNTIFKAVVTDAAGATVGADSTAIKTQTDKMAFTVTNQIDANIQSVNDVTVTGTGAGGDEWGP